MEEHDRTADLPQEPPQPKLAVLVLSHNRVDAMRRCLKALEASHQRELFRVVLLDCGSRDGSAALDTEFPEITIQRLPRNFGATKALNIGIRTVTQEYVFLLDPAVEVSPTTIPALLNLLDARPEAGAVCPLLVDAGGRPCGQYYAIPTKSALACASKTGELPDPMPVPASSEPFAVEFPARLAILLRRQFLKGMNYFDERYGHAWGDAELAFQIWHAQKKILVAPEAPARDHSGEDPLPDWTNAQRATLAADSIHGAAVYVGKRYGMLAGLLFRVGMAFSVLGRLLSFREPSYNLSLLMGLLSGQKIDGSQTAL